MSASRLFGALLFGALLHFAATSEGDVWVESNFHKNSDGWTVLNTEKSRRAPAPKLEVDQSGQRIKSGDEGDVAWYFSAPAKFLGDRSNFYHGTLEYTLVYFHIHRLMLFGRAWC